MTNTITKAVDLKGVFPALFTPLKDDDPKRLNNSIDYDKAQQMIDDLVNAGVAGIVPIGTTGQSATVTPQQHVDFIKFCIEYIQDRVPVIAGAGSNCTRESVETINKIQMDAGQVSFLCVTGYYNNPPQEGLLQHFETVVSETGTNLVIYNVPGRTNSYLTADTIIQLAKNTNIIGLKQAVDFRNPGPNREDTIKIIENTNRSDFAVLTGEDDALLSLLELGGSGMITATGNIPEAAQFYVKLFSAFEQGNMQEAREIHEEIEPFVKACFILKNPIPLADMFNSPVYQPLISVLETARGADLHQQIMELIENKAPSLKKYHQPVTA